MENNEMANETQRRPVFLTVLCVLTFISAGCGSLVSLLVPAFEDQLIEFIQNAPNYDEATMGESITMLRAGWGYYLVMFALSLGSLSGAILMWKQKKLGFHIYALSNLTALFIPMLMFSVAISWSGILFTGCFIALYALNLKYMK
jgi:hypothetical protein